MNEEDLRARYGEPGVLLIRLLYRMRREGGFTNKDAARRWIKSDPERSAAIVSRHDEDGPVIRENRLSDVMAMRNGRVPDGLVQAFLDLWAERAGRSADEVRALADEVTDVYKKVRREPKTTLTPSGRRSKRDADVVRLKDELLSVQHQLVEANKNETRFRNLAFVLLIALNRLQLQYDHLTRERDELLEQAEAAEVVELPRQEAQIAGEQLVRARSQLTETEDRLREANTLVRDLQHLYAHLLARLNNLGVPTTPSTPSGSSPDVPALGSWASGSLEEHERILDRIGQELQEGTQRLEQIRRDVIRSTKLDTDEAAVVDSQVLQSGAGVPENFPTWDFDATNEEDLSHGTPNSSATKSADNEMSRADASSAPSPGGQTKRPPQSGWRKAVFVASGHLINIGASPAEVRRRELIARVNQPVHGSYKIAVLSMKGGVGKTSVTAFLGATFASLRGDRVIAVDADPGRGTLSQKIPLETTATVRHLLRATYHIHRYSDIRAYTSQAPSRLEVLASEQDPAVSEAFSEDDYRHTIALLEHFYNIVLADCGTGLMHSVMKGVLDLADALVVVSSGSVDGARSASATLDWLDNHGYRDLVARSVAVINSVRPRAGSVDLDKLTQHFGARCRAVVRIPFDAHLEVGAEIELDHLTSDTRLALLELAATVADGFPSPFYDVR